MARGNGQICVHCGDQFGWTEFSSTLLKLSGNTLVCLACTEENYLVPQSDGPYLLMALGALIIGILTFILVAGLMPVLTYDGYSGSFSYSPLLIGVGILLGAAAARLTMKIYNWRTGFFSADISDKSDADYD